MKIILNSDDRRYIIRALMKAEKMFRPQEVETVVYLTEVHVAHNYE